MANRISIACHTIRVVDKNTKCFRKLGQVSPDKDLETVFGEYLNSLQEGYAKSDEQQIIRHIRRHDKSGSILKGIIETGEFGYSTDLRNVNDQSLSYHRDRDDAEMMPFYFLAYLPSNRNEGIVLLQKRSNKGVRAELFGDFKKHVEKNYIGVSIEVNSLVPRQLIREHLTKGRLASIRLIQFGLPSDLVDAIDANDHQEKEGRVELKYIPGRGKGLPLIDKLLRFLDGNYEMTKLVEVSSFEYENVKVEIDLYGSKKTLDLSDTNKMNTNIDITQEVQMNDDGFPEFQSIDKIALDLLDDLLDLMGLDREYVEQNKHN